MFIILNLFHRFDKDYSLFIYDYLKVEEDNMSRLLNKKHTILEHFRETISWEEVISEVPKNSIQIEKDTKQIAMSVLKQIRNPRLSSSYDQFM